MEKPKILPNRLKAHMNSTKSYFPIQSSLGSAHDVTTVLGYVIQTLRSVAVAVGATHTDCDHFLVWHETSTYALLSIHRYLQVESVRLKFA